MRGLFSTLVPGPVRANIILNVTFIVTYEMIRVPSTDTFYGQKGFKMTEIGQMSSYDVGWVGVVMQNRRGICL